MNIDASRRGFFGMMTGALAAAPTIGKEVVARLSGTSTGLTRTRTFAGLAGTLATESEKGTDDFAFEDDDAHVETPSPAQRRYRKEIRTVYERAEHEARLEMLRQYGPPPYVLRNALAAAYDYADNGFPPHIEHLRSFSHVTKHRLAVAHYFEREIEKEVRDRTNRLEITRYSQMEDVLTTRFSARLRRAIRARLGLLEPVLDGEMVELADTDTQASGSYTPRHRRRSGKPTSGRRL